MCSVVKLLFCSIRGEIFSQFLITDSFYFYKVEDHRNGSYGVSYSPITAGMHKVQCILIGCWTNVKCQTHVRFTKCSWKARVNKTRPYSAFSCFVCHILLIEIKEISQITDIGKSQFKRSILRRNHNLAKFSKKNRRRLGFLETLTLLEPFLPTFSPSPNPTFWLK